MLANWNDFSLGLKFCLLCSVNVCRINMDLMKKGRNPVIDHELESCLSDGFSFCLIYVNQTGLKSLISVN